MGTLRPVCIIVLLALLGACAANPQAKQTAAAQALAAQQAQLEAVKEANRRQNEQLLAEENARAKAREEAARAAEVAEAEEQARREAVAKQQAAARKPQSAGSSGVKSASQNNPNVGKRADAVTKQQARIAELRAKIAANKAETAKVDSANTSLKQAITAAESLSATLSAEQQKYASTDPATGKTQAPLAKSKIEELSAEVDKLRSQAAALTKDSK